MLQLIYTSIAVAEMSDTDMKALCRQAAQRNDADEITGVLMIKNGQFVQALEGPKEVVENTFLRIIVDRRHKSLQLLSRRMITKRQFGEWSMALCNSDAEKHSTIEQVRSIIVGSPPSLRSNFNEIFPGVLSVDIADPLIED